MTLHCRECGRPQDEVERGMICTHCGGELGEVSPMAQMSKAIRLTIAEHSSDGKLSGLPANTLRDFWEIVDAFNYDLTVEVKKRQRGE